ncbi:MAG TPA: lysylphosphatidylglycerol synthase transmembrane domain-containing protein [Gemmatimonadales bacterium]|nr:lysylphosphatidylglycerol synthase transmembrane domain-containing protein [Gemmatimonadales bacterium]
MHLGFVEAQLLCIALLALDFLARAWRIKWILQGLGHRISTWDGVVLNAFGEGACAVTPMRLGGEPARLAGILRCGVPAPAAFVAISFEVLASWPVVIVGAGWLAWRYSGDWWAMAGPSLVRAAARAWPWLVVVAVVSLLAWLLARRLTHPAVRQIQRPVKRARVYWRRMPAWPLVASVPMSLIDLVTRVAILPVLAMTLPDPPPMGPLWFGSFALLYSQLVLPTPSGAGAVDLGFLGGAAGNLGGDEHLILLLWRVYTNGVGVVLGLALAVRYYGWGIVRKIFRRTEQAIAFSDQHR